MPRAPVERRRYYRHEYPKLHHDGLHHAFWRAADPRRRRLSINIADVAKRFKVSYDVTNDAIIAMREAGRMRPVGYDGGPTKIYEIADPYRWRADDPKTHARPRRTTAWG